MKKCIIVDFDLTLADSSERIKYACPNGTYDFDKFDNWPGKDKLNEWCAAIVKGQSWRGVGYIIITSRIQFHESIIRQFIADNQLPLPEMILCRGNADIREDVPVKTDLYMNFVKDKYEILFAIDDRLGIVNLWRSLGIPALHCANTQ